MNDPRELQITEGMAGLFHNHHEDAPAQDAEKHIRGALERLYLLASFYDARSENRHVIERMRLDLQQAADRLTSAITQAATYTAPKEPRDV